ncbi:MAG: ABC transporter permease [Parabacteroides sp.]|nr:ABC transporter permease [Parabacteroides sp.]
MESVSLKLIFRSWRRNKTFAIISLLSLAIGITCTNLLISYVIYESGIESSNPKKERIIYMAQDSPMTSGQKVSYIVGNIPVRLKDQYPEVEDYLRMNIGNSSFITIGEKHFDPITILMADSSFPRFFPYQVVAGNLNKALTQPNAIALSENRARLFFGNEDAIGKSLSAKIPDEEQPIVYEVAAVIKDYPQSFLTFDAITGTTNDFHGGPTLLLVNDRFNIDTFANKLKADKVPTFQNEIGQYYFYTLQESYFQEQAYIQESIPYINRNQKDLLYVGLFSAILILAIACFNYINLSFSRILQQVKMIYTQKVMGATSTQIHRQLFTDTFLTVLIAFFLSLLLTLDLLPAFNRIVSGRISMAFFFSGQVLPVIGVLILSLSIIPALYMSRKINTLSHSEYKSFTAGSRKRRIIAGLSIAQFAISIGLVFATLTVRQQLKLTQMNGDRYRNLIEIADWSGKHIETFAKEIRRYPLIEDMCLSKGSILHFMLRQLILKDEQGNELYYSLAQYESDSTFLKVMKINILQGLSEREALKQYGTPVYINEQYARLLVPKGENPVGKPVRLYDTEFGKMEKEGEPVAIIAGIIENLYIGTLRQEVYPSLTYLMRTPPYNLVQIRLKEEHKAEALALLKQTWEKINPNAPFEYQDIYEEFMASNRKTIELAHLLIMYSIISLLLTAFGLFGMALYVIEQRTKEIGIRKVNGATTGEILYLLNRQFIGWIGIAFAIAVPITWYSLSEWLENFVYRVDISIETCLLSGGIVWVVTLLTISGHSYKAASRNPVNALRSE